MTRYKAPTQYDVQVMLRRVLKPEQRRAFYSGLVNPLWMKPLAKEGAFTNPPEPEVTADGLVRDVYWPEIEYLVRVSRDEPEAVVDVLLKFQDSNNAWVRRATFEIGAGIPARQAARLRPLVAAWRSSGLGWRTDPRHLIGYAINLLNGGQEEIGKWFADLIFKPSGVEGDSKGDLVLDDYWYAYGLPKVIAALGENALPVVVAWLVACERKIGHLRRGADYTYFTRESVRTRAELSDDLEGLLIDAVRDLAIDRFAKDSEATADILLNTKMLLARKIALFAMSEAVQQLSSDEVSRSRLLEVAAKTMFEESSSHDSCRIDFAELARSVARVSPELLEPMTGFIEGGAQVDRDRLRERMQSEGEVDGSILDERVQDHGDRWQHRWLSAIGVDSLPAQLRDRLAELDTRYGVIDAPLEPHPLVITWTGDRSPTSRAEMAAMTQDELLAHLESWRSPVDHWGPEPSHEGQGRELSALVSAEPLTFAGAQNLLERLRPIYITSVLQGWLAALKAGSALDWYGVIEVLHGIFRDSHQSTVPVQGGVDGSDIQSRSLKRAAVELLEEIAKKRVSPAVPDAAFEEFAAMLVDRAADETAWNEYLSDHSDTSMDPLTASLNWPWPIALRGLIILMSRGTDTAWYESARSTLDAQLSRFDPGGASRAVVGEGLGRLLSVDPDWLKPRIAGLFGSEAGLSEGQQIALSTAIVVHYYHAVLFELLGPSMVAAVRLSAPIVAGWRSHSSNPLRRIGEWAIESIIYGEGSIDDPVPAVFFAEAPPKVRGEAIGHIGWSFMHAETVDVAIRDRFSDLWDTRVSHVRAVPADQEELDGFHWFVKSRKFPVDWWLPRLREAAELDPNVRTERYVIGKELASAADYDPRTAFEVLKLLFEARDEAGMSYDLARNALPMVIAKAISSGDGELKAEAEEYMNQLGESGNLSLEAEVIEVLSGTDSPERR